MWQKRCPGGYRTNRIDFKRTNARTWNHLEQNTEMSPQKACGSPTLRYLWNQLSEGVSFQSACLQDTGCTERVFISFPCSLFLRFCEFLSPSQWQEFTPHQTPWQCWQHDWCERDSRLGSRRERRRWGWGQKPSRTAWGKSWGRAGFCSAPLLRILPDAHSFCRAFSRSFPGSTQSISEINTMHFTAPSKEIPRRSRGATGLKSWSQVMRLSPWGVKQGVFWVETLIPSILLNPYPTRPPAQPITDANCVI